MEHLCVAGDDARLQPGQLRRLWHGDLQLAFLHGGAQQGRAVGCNALVEQGFWRRREDIGGPGFVNVAATIKQGGGGQGGQHGRVVVGVPVAG
ncbi:hypothetical protein D9M71_722220 [compost metagenome]